MDYRRGAGPTMAQIRNTTIDAAKGIGILLLAFAHSWIVLDRSPVLYQVIGSFLIPLFFFLSGVFLNSAQPFGAFLKTRFISLLKPYLVVMLAIGVLRVATDHISAWQFVQAAFWGTGRSIGSAAGWSAFVPLWFLPHLSLTLLLAWIVARLTRNSTGWMRCTALLVCLLAGLMLIDCGPRIAGTGMGVDPLPFSADLALISVSFVLAGHWMSAQVRNFRANRGLFALALLAFVTLHVFFDSTIDLNQRRYDNYPVTTLEAAAGIYLILCLAEWSKRLQLLERALVFAGAASLFILMFHYPFQDLALRAMTRISRETPYSNSAIAVVASVVLSLLSLAVVKASRPLSLLLLPSATGLRRTTESTAH